jgi:hypothetical protein
MTGKCQLMRGGKPGGAAADDADGFPGGRSGFSAGALPSARTLSAAKYLRCAMEIGASTRLRRQAVSHGCGHTLPIAAGSGKVVRTVATASAKRPSAISFTYFWQSV